MNKELALPNEEIYWDPKITYPEASGCLESRQIKIGRDNSASIFIAAVQAVSVSTNAHQASGSNEASVIWKVVN